MIATTSAALPPVASPTVTDAKRRVLDQLKHSGPNTVPTLAAELGLTQPAIRQHLQALKANGLTDSSRGAPAGRGRPAVRWALTALAQELFPDRHADLTVELIQAMRESVGEAGVNAVIAARAGHQIEAYRERLATKDGLKDRVEALADQRSREGYMAEVQTDAGSDSAGGFLLIEHHCPICDAAAECQGLCAGELDVFRGALGPEVEVERIEHLLSDGDRCVYRISPTT